MRGIGISIPPSRVEVEANHRDQYEISNEQSTIDTMIFLRGSFASRQITPRYGGAPTLCPAKNGTLGQHPTKGLARDNHKMGTLKATDSTRATNLRTPAGKAQEPLTVSPLDWGRTQSPNPLTNQSNHQTV